MAIRRPSIVRLPWVQADDENALPGLGGPTPVLPVIDQQLTQMFALVSEAIAGATHSLLTGDREAAKAIVAADEQIDEIALALTDLVDEALIGSGRSAEERRELVALGRILPEIERNGDLAEHIARRAARGLGQEISSRARGLVERIRGSSGERQKLLHAGGLLALVVHRECAGDERGDQPSTSNRH